MLQRKLVPSSGSATDLVGTFGLSKDEPSDMTSTDRLFTASHETPKNLRGNSILFGNFSSLARYLILSQNIIAQKIEISGVLPCK